MTTQPAAGWYDDPQDPDGQRYWDGQGWTPHRHRKPISQSAPPPANPPTPGGPAGPGWPDPSPEARAVVGQTLPPPPGQGYRDAEISRAALQGSVWVTNGMAVYSLIIGGMGFLLDFFCGAGLPFAVIGGIVGVLALNKSKTLNGQGQRMAIAGIAVCGAALAFGLLWIALFGFAMVG